jgi:hypothetical protein
MEAVIHDAFAIQHPRATAEIERVIESLDRVGLCLLSS